MPLGLHPYIWPKHVSNTASVSAATDRIIALIVLCTTVQVGLIKRRDKDKYPPGGASLDAYGNFKVHSAF